MAKEEEPRGAPPADETARIARGSGEGGRLRIDVREHEAVLDEMLKSEDVVVERVPLGKIVQEAPPVRQEGDTLVIPLVEEEIFVKRRLVVREEIRVTKRTDTRRHQERVTLHSQEAVIGGHDPEEDADDRRAFDALPSFGKRAD